MSQSQLQVSASAVTLLRGGLATQGGQEVHTGPTFTPLGQEQKPSAGSLTALGAEQGIILLLLQSTKGKFPFLAS